MRDDLVSRKEIIDSLVNEYNRKRTNDGLKLAWIEKAVNVVPSAQLGTNLAEVGTDCISRQQAIDALTEAYEDIDAEWILRKLPSAQRTGKWLDANICGELPVIVCDQCNTFYPLSFGAFHNFCPNCGAKMEVTE